MGKVLENNLLVEVSDSSSRRICFVKKKQTIDTEVFRKISKRRKKKKNPKDTVLSKKYCRHFIFPALLPKVDKTTRS